LPTGFVFVATQQIQGRGRGSNSWISPPGCLQFSIVLRHPLNSSSPVVFIQYLLSLAVVEAVRTKKGYEVCSYYIKILTIKTIKNTYTYNIYALGYSPSIEMAK
jgi:biotin-(acetyl-CoA carboxylase) ligase